LIIDDYVAIANDHKRIFAPPPEKKVPEVPVEPLLELTEDDIRELLAAFELHIIQHLNCIITTSFLLDRDRPTD
jgi:hypothetical protein